MDPWNRSGGVDVITMRMTVVSGSWKGKCRMLCRLAMTASAVGILTACGATGDVPSAEEETAYAESAPPLDEAVDFFLYTHCGVESLRVDGRWWHAVEPLYGDVSPGSPPDGWGDPFQEGELTLNSEQSITFEAEGTAVEFVPAPEDKPMRLCR